jgi:hypothetical protein
MEPTHFFQRTIGNAPQVIDFEHSLPRVCVFCLVYFFLIPDRRGTHTGTTRHLTCTHTHTHIKSISCPVQYGLFLATLGMTALTSVGMGILISTLAPSIQVAAALRCVGFCVWGGGGGMACAATTAVLRRCRIASNRLHTRHAHTYAHTLSVQPAAQHHLPPLQRHPHQHRLAPGRRCVCVCVMSCMMTTNPSDQIRPHTPPVVVPTPNSQVGSLDLPYPVVRPVSCSQRVHRRHL